MCPASGARPLVSTATEAVRAVSLTDIPPRPATTGRLSPVGHKDDRLERWRDGVARDPWVEECINILGDMAK